MWQNKEVYIVGTSYSGSTFLSNLLNAHPKIFSVGELSGWFDDFDFGINDAFCPVCATEGQRCPVFNDEFKTVIQQTHKEQVISLIRKAVGKPVIVDSSKFPSWFDHYFSHKVAVHGAHSWRYRFWRSRVRVIILARSPFAFFASVRRREKLSTRATKLQWITCYENALKMCEKYNVPFRTLRFEQLLIEPEATVKQLCRWIGVRYHPKMLQFWEIPVHSLGGNAGAYMWYKSFREKGQFATKGDQKRAQEYADRQFSVEKTNSWRHLLSRREINAVLRDQAVVHTAEKLGYDLNALISV